MLRMMATRRAQCLPRVSATSAAALSATLASGHGANAPRRQVLGCRPVAGEQHVAGDTADFGSVA